MKLADRSFILLEADELDIFELILDIGYGPAEILVFLPELEYHGFDISESYIQNAKDRYGDRGILNAQYLTNDSLKKLPSFDVALMFGVLHHLDDETSKDMIQLSKNALRKGGRLLIIDPAIATKQLNQNG